jgi:hypothetical protein
MTDERDFPDCEQFIAEVHACGLTTVVIAWQQEYGQVLGAPGVVFDRLAHFSLLAYHKPTSTILRCHQQGGAEERATMATRLRTAGFTVEERDRNEVKFRTR